MLKEQGLPEDLKYLMVIESNLDPKAVSSAGAAGLWQFMRGTAREYGLVCDDEVDERYNIEKGTLAACAYLRDAYSKFRDWTSVAASYNSGQNGISRRREEQRQTSALDLWMPEDIPPHFPDAGCKMFLEHPGSFRILRFPGRNIPTFRPVSGSR